MTKLIGTAPNQVPTNADLGTLAYQDSASVNISGGVATGLSSLGVGTALPTSSLAFGQTESGTGISFQSTDATFNSGVVANIRAVISGSGLGSLVLQTFEGGSGGGERMRIAATGEVLISALLPVANISAVTAYTPVLQVSGTSAARSSIGINRFENAVAGAYLQLAKSRSATVGTFTAVQGGDILGTLSFAGADGVDFAEAATITAEVDATPGSNDMPGRLIFKTTSDGSSTPQERMRIDSIGNVGIGSPPLNYGAGISSISVNGSSGGIFDSLSGGARAASLFSTATEARLDAFGTRPWNFYTGAGFRMQISSAGVVSAFANVSSTSTTTGTLVVSGGAGISGAVYAGSVFASTTLRVLGSSSTMGYGSGSGGAVTQLTSRTTGVTLNKGTGSITLFSAAGTSTPTTFTVANSVVSSSDVILLTQRSGTNLYLATVTAVFAGSFNVTFYALSGTAADSPVFNFVIVNGSTL